MCRAYIGHTTRTHQTSDRMDSDRPGVGLFPSCFQYLTGLVVSNRQMSILYNRVFQCFPWGSSLFLAEVRTPRRTKGLIPSGRALTATIGTQGGDRVLHSYGIIVCVCVYLLYQNQRLSNPVLAGGWRQLFALARKRFHLLDWFGLFFQLFSLFFFS